MGKGKRYIRRSGQVFKR